MQQCRSSMHLILKKKNKQSINNKREELGNPRNNEPPELSALCYYVFENQSKTLTKDTTLLKKNHTHPNSPGGGAQVFRYLHCIIKLN
jgi:hypothetical protein